MPRPIKEGLDYFPLDTALLSQDKRIRTLLRKFGADGITFLIALWCDIYGGTGYYVVADDEYLEEMSHETGINLNTIRQILAYLLDRSLFDSTLFQSVKVLSAPGIQRRFQLAVKERVRKRRAPVIVESAYWLLPEEEEETVTFKEDGTARCIKVIQKRIVPRKNSLIPRNNEVIPRNKCTKESKGKESKGKNRERVRESTPAPPSRSFGRYENVRLTDAEYLSLAEDFGKAVVADYIDRLARYMKKTGRTYDSHEAVIRDWVLDDRKKEGQKNVAQGNPLVKQNRFHNFDQVGYDYDAIVKELNGNGGHQ